jgi:hypothetical protein
MESRTPAKVSDLPTLTAWQNPATGEIRIIDKTATDALAETAKDVLVKTSEVTATAYRPDAKSPAKVLPVFERVAMAKDATAVDFKPKGLREEDAGSVGLRGLDEVVLAGQRFRVNRAGHETMADPVTGEQLLKLDLVKV